MEKDERKRLKKLGKEIVERKSQDVRDALARANAAPVGSDEWAANYREQTTRERELRINPPDVISAEEASQNWITLSTDQVHGREFIPVRTVFYQCRKCNSLVHSAPQSVAGCACGNITIDPHRHDIAVQDATLVSRVKLLATTDKNQPKRTWWRRILGR